MNKSNIFLIFLLVVVIIRWYFFGGYWLMEEDITLMQPVQEYLQTLCKNMMPEPQSSLLSGILIGQKQDLDSDFKKALTNTSTIHIVVVSGQNLSMLAGFLLAFAPFFGRKKTILATIGVLTSYSVLTGLQLPVIRAACMSLFSLVGMLFNREVNSLKTLIFTLLIMLLINPTWMDSISFQLSFLATAGVMVLAPEIIKTDTRLPELFKQDLWVSLSAQAMTLPVIAINFHRVSMIGIVTNLLVLWTVPFIMIGGIAALTGMVFSPILGQFLGLFPNILLLYFTEVVNLTNQRWGSVYLEPLPDIFWIGYYITFIGIYLFLKAKNNQTDSINTESPRVLTY